MANIAAYKKGWELIERREKVLQEKRRAEALKIAEDLKDILVQEFKVSRVILFGAVLKKHGFDMDSDIDIAVEGLAKKSYFKAVARLMMQSQFPVDLKPMEDVRESVRKRIAKGVALYEERASS
ncbi:MAG: hypothetical protein Q8P28_04135 [Deltaproteobacteria bacterium]|nr:hypothetical protein [Deltaproteobacteria bacterium]